MATTASVSACPGLGQGLFYFYDKPEYFTHCMPSKDVGTLHITHFIFLIVMLLLSHFRDEQTDAHRETELLAPGHTASK